MGRKLDSAIGLYMDGIRDGNPREAVATHTGDRYTQHSTGVPDGREGFIEFFDEFLARNPVRDIRIVRGFEDGRYVFVHAFQSLNDGEAEWVTMDFFDTDENDKLIEHWDVIAEYSSSTPSGHTSIDGPTEVVDRDLTEDNKVLVEAMIRDILMEDGDPTNVDRYISGVEYIRHDMEVPGGLTAVKPLVYDEIVLLVGQGNFVASLCRARREGAPYVQADLFRVEGGLIVEHWETAEPIGPPEEWVNSGKF